MEQSVQQQGPTLSGEGTYSSRGRTLLGTAVRVDAKSWRPSRSRWTDPDIRIFLQEWEVVEAEIGHPGRKIHKKTRALCQRLFHRGLKKSWQSCFDLLVSLQYLHRKLCSERPRTEPLFSPYAEALYRILGHRPQGSYFPGEGTYSSRGRTLLGTAVRVDAKSWRPSRSRWTDPDIRIFLQEWEVVEAEIGHPGRKIHKKTRALCQRLFHRGLKKSWQSCFDLLVSLQYLHRKLCSERPRTEPLFSPYAEALYRILGHRPQGSYFPGPPKYGAGYPLYPMDPQLPMVIPSAPHCSAQALQLLKVTAPKFLSFAYEVLAGPSRSRWTDPDIRIFLQEWEVVEVEIGHPGRKIHKKTRALCQRLFHRGLKKSWQSCFDLLC
ncbi:uncharacterized protein LOC127230057 [Phodopus roborovskii]|uniref:uncharacterized protein LOC127230057 n=1 Tax=Phodopus roborovskii TaxID=109678 RepID=UPI0021E3E5AC|nr:uncharacterized protein LOC127230057 [Phodopus roborovskii]